MLKKKDTPSFTLYRHISKLKLDRFITALVDNDLSVLIIKGTPTAEILKEAWESILEQYTEATGGAELLAKMNDVKDYSVLYSKINRAHALVQIIESGRVGNAVIQQLYTFDFPLPKFAEGNIDKVLKTFTAHLKRQVVELKMLEDKIKPEGKEPTEMTRDNFYSQLVDMAELFKMPVLNEAEVTVALYCSFLNKYKSRVEMIMKNQNKKQ